MRTKLETKSPYFAEKTKTKCMSPRMPNREGKCEAVLFTTVQRLFFVLVMLFENLGFANSASRCVDSLKSVGSSKTVGIRFFPANSSFAIVDFDSRFTIWDKTGKIVHSEPLDLGFFNNRPVKTQCAVIQPSGSLYLVLTDGTTAHYLGGAKTNAVPFGPLTFTNPVWAHPSSCGLNLAVNVHFFTADQTVPQMSHSGNFNTFWLNFKILNRISVHGYNGDIFFVNSATSICPIRLVQNGQLLQTNNSAPSCATQTDTGAYSITSSIGSRSDFIVYTRLVRQTMSNYTQEIVLRSRSAGTTTSIEFRNFRIHSFAIHPSLNKIFALSTQGGLYSFNFDPALVTIDLACTEINAGFNGKYMEMQLIDPSGLLIHSTESLAIYNITSNTMLVLVDRPSYFKPLPVGNTGLLVYENRRIMEYDPHNHQELQLVVASNIIHLATSNTASNVLFCVTTPTSFSVYSWPAKALIATKTLQQLEAFGVSTVTKVISIDSVAFHPVTSATIMVALFCEFTTVWDTGSLILLLDAQTLSPSVPTVMYRANPSLHITSLVWGRDPAGGSDFPVFATAPMYTFWLKYNPTSGFVETSKNEITFRYTSVVTDPVSNNYKAVNSHGQSRSVQFGSNTIMALGSGSQSSVYCTGTTCPSDRQPWLLPFPDSSFSSMLESDTSPTLGHLFWSSGHFLKSVDLQNFGRMILMRSESLRQGALYSSVLPNGKVALFVTSGQGSTLSFSPDQCYYGNGEGWHEIYGLCDVPNCASCNMFDPLKCKQCNSPYFVSLDETSCDATCATGWKHLDTCVSQCPLNTYRTTDGSVSCTDQAACSADAKFIQGHYCVASCAAGLLLSGNFCLCPPGSKIAQSTPTGAQCIPTTLDCPNGEVYWSHSGNCIPRSDLPTRDILVVNNTQAYCDPFSYYLELATGKCVVSCGASSPLQGTSTEKGRFCVSVSECINNLGYFVDTSASPIACVKDCSANPTRPYSANSECVPNCEDLSLLVDEYNRKCVTRCAEMGKQIDGQCYRSLELGYMNCTWIKVPDLLIRINLPLKFITSEELITEASEVQKTTVESICVQDDGQPENCISGSDKLDYNISTNSSSSIKNINLDLWNSKLEFASKRSLVVTVIFNESSPIKANGMLSMLNPKVRKSCAFKPTQTDKEIKPRESDWSDKAVGLIKPVAGTMQVIRALLPLAMVALMDPQIGSMLGLISQSYSKLVMLSYFGFARLHNSFARLYYQMFEEIFDDVNEALMGLVIGPRRVQAVKQSVCQEGLDKLCQLTVEENFYLSYATTFVVLLVQVVGAAGLILLSNVTKSKAWGDYMRQKLRSSMIPSFLVENTLEFSFSMMLTAYVTQYSDPVLTTFKVLSHVSLFIWTLGGVGLLLAARKTPATTALEGCLDSLTRASDWDGLPKQPDPAAGKGESLLQILAGHFERRSGQLLDSFNNVFRDVLVPRYQYRAVKLCLMLDYILACFVVFLQKQPIIQIACWMLFDGSSAVLLTRLKIFNTDILNYRQRVFAYFLILIEACMLMTEIVSDQDTKVVLSAGILILSIGALFMDVGFVLVMSFRMIKSVVGGSKSNVMPETTSKMVDFPPLEAKQSLREGSLATGNLRPISPIIMEGHLQLFKKLPMPQVYSVRKVVKQSGAKQNLENSGELASTARILSNSLIKTSKVSIGDSMISRGLTTKIQKPRVRGEKPAVGYPAQSVDQKKQLEAEGGISPSRAKIISKITKQSLRKESYS